MAEQFGVMEDGGVHWGIRRKLDPLVFSLKVASVTSCVLPGMVMAPLWGGTSGLRRRILTGFHGEALAVAEQLLMDRDSWRPLPCVAQDQHYPCGRLGEFPAETEPAGQ